MDQNTAVLIAAGGGWLASQIQAWFVRRADDRHRREDRIYGKLDREEDFQRQNLLRLQTALDECCAACGRYLTAPNEELKREAKLETSALGRKSNKFASRVSDEPIRTEGHAIAEQVGQAMGWANIYGLAENARWQELINRLTQFLAQIGERLRDGRPLVRRGSTVTTLITESWPDKLPESSDPNRNR
jgi:hypothetical protein